MRRGEVTDEKEHHIEISIGFLADLGIVCLLSCGVTVVKAVR